MAVLLVTLCSLIFMLCSTNAQPSLVYSPTSKFRTVGFYQGFRNLWGAQHQRFDQNTLTIWLDSSSGGQVSLQVFFVDDIPIRRYPMEE
ncbi:hypothetical protein Scep_015444 [Stephania cephalantha]|uniref:Uncharacterized protein n=1 Tax=Stephania cephalantha TaxID=152367 RepID=A0AAP0J392_9MAGN